MPKLSLYNPKGFTVVEILVAVTVLGVISAFVYTAINPTVVRHRSEDAIRLANIQKLAEGLESYLLIERSVPLDTDGDGNPSNMGDNPELGKYVGLWPDGRPLESDRYFHLPDMVTGHFGVVVLKDDLRYYKYRSETAWGKRVRECGTATVVGDLICP